MGSDEGANLIYFFQIRQILLKINKFDFIIVYVLIGMIFHYICMNKIC